jgi:hypothetical protein
VSSGPTVAPTGLETRSNNKTALEMLAVLLLGITTVATAWCGFQASSWNNEEAEQAHVASLARIESSRLFTLGAQLVAYDSNLTAQYATAVLDDNLELQTFLRETLMRPEFLPVLDEWQRQVDAGEAGAANLFTNDEYLDAQFADSVAAGAESDVANELAKDASTNADAYVLTTLLTATALFFAGVTTSFASRSARLTLILGSGIVMAVVAARLADLPTI